ncbi:hypothetical protein IEQ34_025273 [Dendrobium chrysotoxum]|uniref:Uncharacterized protein n=1 Tax=Dendrobium chrysotoxum TaxID=161865 RepID=A0AAV7FQR7_DENCH|nr:hypothetical protein IEQ34_025273 [Dendrobium chrysotoxum]
MQSTRNMSREDLERVMFFQEAREQAHKAVQNNPSDATAHTQLGGALLELSHFQAGPESNAMIQEASDRSLSKIVTVIQMEKEFRLQARVFLNLQLLLLPGKKGFLTPDHEAAKEHFLQAKNAFLKPTKRGQMYGHGAFIFSSSFFDVILQMQEPENDMYKKAMEMTDKAPDLHADLHRQISAQEGLQEPLSLGGGEATSSKTAGGSAVSEFWYDAAGWVILIGLGAAWMSLFRTEQAANTTAR